jgi:transcriptional regulator of met regulon
MLEAHIVTRKELVDRFCETYESSILEAQTKLGPRFNPGDYPTKDEARDSFKYRWSYMQFGVSEALKEISTEMFRREQEKAEEQWKQVDSSIRTLLRTSMKELVDHMVERLTPGEDGKKKRFTKNSLENIEAFLRTFDARNLTDDVELQKVVEQVKKLTDGLPAEQVRTDEALRDSLKIGFDKIKTSLDGMIVLAPMRRIELPD